jgi:hypothetical protein
MLGDLVLLIYIYMADATSTHIYALAVIFPKYERRIINSEKIN